MKHMLIAAALTGGLLLGGWVVHAESNRVTFPDLDKQVHYTTVKRGNVTEHISTTREAIDAMQNGRPIPDGTHFVLADYRDGTIHRYFVMEKGKDFGADFDERTRTDDWRFQWFWPDQRINLKETTTRCMACHRAQRNQGYLFTGGRILDFHGTPVE